MFRNKRCRSWMIILLGVLLSVCELSVAEQVVDYVSVPYREDKNVSCVFHDTQFSCDCGNVDESLNLPRLSGHVFHVSVTNCKSLSVPSNTLADTQGLRKVIFKKVSNLVLEEHSLAFPRYASNTPLILGFEDVDITKIHSHAISGNIEEISFVGGSVATIRAFAFTTLKEQAMLLKFDSVYIDLIESQAFKKFTVDQLDLSNCVITSNLPSKSFYDIEVPQLLRISNVTFKEVHTRAFSFKTIRKLLITQNKFKGVDGEWIEAEIKENALIKNNNFGVTSHLAFKGIKVHRDYSASERLEMRVVNNSVKMAGDILPLAFNDKLQVNINQLQYRNQFKCQMLENRQPKIRFFHTFQDAIFFQTRNNEAQSLSVAKVIDHDCPEQSYLVYIVIGVSVAILLLLVIAGVVVYKMLQKNKQRKMDIVMPEPRTYKETQIVLQIENAGLLRTDL